MMDNWYSDEYLYKDTYTIIQMMPQSMKEKINEDFIIFLKENQCMEFEGTIDKNTPLKNQNIRNEIKVMLSLIYISYFCTKERQNEIKAKDEKNINSLYNENIFKKREKNSVNVEEKNDCISLEIVEPKGSFWKKIIKKIKEKLFNKG